MEYSAARNQYGSSKGARLSALFTYQGGDAAFIKLVAECEIEAQKDYCRMFHIKRSALNKDEPAR